MDSSEDGVSCFCAADVSVDIGKPAHQPDVGSANGPEQPALTGVGDDIRLAAEDALIGSPEARVSSSVTGGAFRLIQQLVGPGKASELLFTAENIDGREAARIGGLIPANMLALYLNIPLMDLDGFLEGRMLGGGTTRAVRP